MRSGAKEGQQSDNFFGTVVHGASNLTKSLAEAADTCSFMRAVMGIEAQFAH
jgi:hypothetical protein